ncbi:YopX protein [compost metagenome]
MQFTGLKDKNGKEIYEGDILSNGQHIDWIVDYHMASFVVKHVGAITEDSWVLNRGMAESREVIGNIYERPDLLEVD